MTITYTTAPHYRNRRKAQGVAAIVELNRVRAMPAVRHLAGRFDMPIATAIMIAQAAGLNVGADR